MGELQGSLAKGPRAIRKQFVQADAFDTSLPDLPVAGEMRSPLEGKGGHILTSESF